MRRVRQVVILGLLGLVAAMGCKSVDTSSAILRNQEGNYEKAIVLAKKALAANPNDAEAHFQLGFSYSQLDSVALAYEHFMKAKQLDPKKVKDVENNIQHNFAKHYKLGQSSFNRQDFAAAAQEFDMAAKSDPTKANAHYNLAVAYSQLALADSSYHEKALQAADKVLELSNTEDPNYMKALELAGRELVKLGRSDEARNRFQRLIDEDPSNYGVIQNIANDLIQEENWKGAEEFYKMTAEAQAKVGAEDHNVYYNIGVALWGQRKEDPNAASEAVEYYQKALELNPDDPTTVFNIVVAYSYLEDWSNAAQWGEKYVSLASADYKGWQLLARAYKELGEDDKVKEAMARYEALKGSQ